MPQGNNDRNEPYYKALRETGLHSTTVNSLVPVSVCYRGTHELSVCNIIQLQVTVIMSLSYCL